MTEPMFKIVNGKRVEMTAAEVAKLEADQAAAQTSVASGPESEPMYRDLSDVEFMSLVRAAGPLTPAQFVQIMETGTADEIIMLRIMLKMNTAGISRSADLVDEGLKILRTASFLTDDGIARIMDNWPTY